ncbi:hypothetical protein [uncultured Brevundimonas sp.]|uniref:hypothetical protein n=1 Tax=uncultured Brevundimonas sp. TaxID=213418 RepID=UPI0025EE9AB3|nr:hypothetical protein [uncultured Brevundimonas sp.]
MSRVVWTTLAIEGDLEERTWKNVQAHEWTVRHYCRFKPNPAADWVDGFVDQPTGGFAFAFVTDAQAIAFRLTHPDHLIDEPAFPELWSGGSSPARSLNRLPRLEAA